MTSLRSTTILFALAACLGSCNGTSEYPEVEPPEPTLRRLTQAQYANTVADLLGPTVVLPTRLEPDSAADGYLTVGAAVTTISPRGAELYEDAAYSLASQAMADTAVRDAIVPCAPSATVDADCAGQFVESFGYKAWRRHVTDDEAERLVAIAGTSATALDDFHEGLGFAMAAILQSPNFLFRAELGEPDPGDPGRTRFTDYEMASRLSYFLWNTTPDDTLLAAAEAGELTTIEGLTEHAERMLADPLARRGLREFYKEQLFLYKLDELSKDPLVYTHMSEDIGPAAQEETLRLFERIVFDDNADYRTIFTTRQTSIDRTLAAIYNVPAPEREGFGLTELPGDGERVGVLGQVSVLALHSHAVSSSATLRGIFVRETLLCQPIPLPPSNANTAIPEATGETPTLRDRVHQHLTDPGCASCHDLTDHIGLGFEHFDGIGRYRTTDNDYPIDATGEFDGRPWQTFPELAEQIATHPDVPYCFTNHMFRYANGHSPELGEMDGVRDLEARFVKSKHSVTSLVLDLIVSPAYRQTAPVDTAAEPSNE